MALQPLDVLVALYLALGGSRPPFAKIATDLGVSPSQAHSAFRHATHAGLVSPHDGTARRPALLEFLTHGVQYAFPASRGPIERGIPTSHSAPPLSAEIQEDGMPVVWPHPQGSVRGETLEPLHRSAVIVALRPEFERLYHALTLIDAIRCGRTRERRLASQKLKQLLEA